MTELEAAYLGIVLIAFALFSGTLFWGMMTSNSLARIRDRGDEENRSPHR